MIPEHHILLAAGGTAGHVFPAKALAISLLKKKQLVTLVTDKRGLAFGKNFPDVKIYSVKSRTLGRGIKAKIHGLVELLIGYIEAKKLLKKIKPDIVVGFGGYASFPTVWAAQRLKIKTILHEQNAVLGRANRVLARRATAVATSFPKTQRLKNTHNTVLTGNPIQPDIHRIRTQSYLKFEQTLSLLVIGGSQGARVFSDVVPKAIKLLPQHLRQRCHVFQQCRKEDLEKTQNFYNALNVTAETGSFFTDIADKLARSHLVICRAGSSTLAEITVAGRPSILVPYPHAADNHQYYNAESLVSVGAAWMMLQDHFTPQILATQLETFFAVPSLLSNAGSEAQKWAPIHAARKLTTLVLKTLGTNA